MIQIRRDCRSGRSGHHGIHTLHRNGETVRAVPGLLSAPQKDMNKLPVACYQLGEFCPNIATFWLAKVGRNQSINTKFTKLITARWTPRNVKRNGEGPKPPKDVVWIENVSRAVRSLDGHRRPKSSERLAQRDKQYWRGERVSASQPTNATASRPSD